MNNSTTWSGSDIRFGVQAHYHIMPAESFDPWVGLGIGYEIASSTIKAGGSEVSGSNKGMEFVNLQAGGDYKVSPNFSVGPFAAFTVGQYSSSTVKIGGTEQSGDIQDKGIHEWLMLGVRGAFNL